MAITSFSQFTELHSSVLQEIGNMGSGGAATALADMLGKPTDISVPMVRTVGIAEAKALITALSGRTIAVLISLSGDLKGHILHVIPFEFAERVIRTYFPDAEIKSVADLNEMSLSVINEMVNITTGAYANSMAQLSSMFVDISTPQRCADTASEIINSCHLNDNAMCFVNNTMIILDCKRQSNMLFFPELETIKKFMGKLGIEC